jgi:hypothetical protein
MQNVTLVVMQKIILMAMTIAKAILLIIHRRGVTAVIVMIATVAVIVMIATVAEIATVIATTEIVHLAKSANQ